MEHFSATPSHVTPISVPSSPFTKPHFAFPSNSYKPRQPPLSVPAHHDPPMMILEQSYRPPFSRPTQNPFVFIRAPQRFELPPVHGPLFLPLSTPRSGYYKRYLFLVTNPLPQSRAHVPESWAGIDVSIPVFSTPPFFYPTQHQPHDLSLAPTEPPHLSMGRFGTVSLFEAHFDRWLIWCIIFSPLPPRPSF